MDEQQAEPTSTPMTAADLGGTEAPEANAEHKALIERWCATINRAKKHHAAAFKRMRDDQKFAADTDAAQWDGNADKYVANLTLRHVRNKVGALYAKNPKVKAQRVERLEYTIWDGKIESLNAAIQVKQTALQYEQAMMTGVPPAPTVDNATGALVPPPPPPDPNQVMLADALIADAVQGFQRKQMLDKVGKSVEILFHHQMREQNPHFKKELKQLVRRVVTCGVGWLKMGFQRDLEKDPNTIDRLTDSTRQIAHIEGMLAECEDPYEGAKREAQKAELENAVKAMQAEAEIVIREGLSFSFPLSDQVIVDPRCRQLAGVVGAGWIAVEHMMTPDDVKESFRVDLGRNYRGYVRVPSNVKGVEGSNYTARGTNAAGEDDYACVWEIQDKKGGNVFWVCEGHQNYLRAPAPPPVKVEGFFDCYELLFNAVENQYELYPPSDVQLLRHSQREYNRNREALRMHRIAAQPRWITTIPMDEELRKRLAESQPFEIIDGSKGLPPGADASKLFTPVAMPGIDPGMYDNTPVMDDIQKEAGAQDANFGATSKSTATESTIAEGARVTGIDDNKDDLDDFLTLVARDGGQILLTEISKETVMKVVGPGAAWPEFSRDEIQSEIYLEIVAGSSGRPNKAMEVSNFERVMPMLIQIPGISPNWLARTAISRLEDNMNIDEALAEGMPSMNALNAMAGKAAAQPGTGDPATNPSSQGPAGANKAPANPAGAQPPPEGMFPAGA